MNEIKLLHDFFEKQSIENPSKIAIVDYDGKYSYSEIQHKVDNLSCRILQSQKITRETKIGIVADRSAESIVAILAVLKCGNTFVPINPELPLQRLKLIFSKAKINSIILTKKHWKSITTCQTELDLELIDSQVPDSCHDMKAISVSENSVAYCLFTSGSTGDPKGVLIRHSGIVQSVKNFTKAYHINKDSHVLQFASLSFDASLSEIFPAFATGATLYIPPKEIIFNIDSLSEYIKRYQISVAILPPTIIQYLSEDSLSSLSVLVSAGEECSIGLANTMCKIVPHFINAYGPTEASVGVTTYEINEKIDDIVPIGKALSGNKLYVLNESLQRVPTDQIGELYIGGIGVFAGYINDEKKTNEVLLRNPFGDGYLYKTGDLVRRDSNGLFYYIGRSDFRIKLHGIRISPEEIEREIIQLPKVYECAVVDGLIENNNERRLVCYYTAPEELDITKTRIALQSSLPLHAVPQVFVRIPLLPLTPNGKIDRQLLKAKPVKIITKIHDSDTIQSLDSAIARIWKAVLGIDSISLDDNFFELGGTSLSAMRIISQINARTNFQADIDLIFEKPIFKYFVYALENKPLKPERCEIKRIPSDRYVTESERLFWIADHNLTKREAYTLTEIFEIEGTVNLDKLQKAFEFLINQHPILRSNFRLNGDKIEKIINIKETYPYYLHDYSNFGLEEAIEKASLTRDQITNKTLDLEKDWLFNAHYLKIANEKGLLIFHLHHIVADAKAMDIMSRSFWNFYADSPDNERSNVDIASSRPTLDNAELFWREYLAKEENDLISLPYDNPKESVIENDGKTLTHSLPIPLAKDAHRAAALLGITPFSLFRNMFSLLLHRLSCQENLMVGTAVSLRDENNDYDIGVFLNTLPIRSKLQKNERVRQYLYRQNKEFLQCFKYRSLPLHLIIKQAKEGTTDFQSLFNVMFDYITDEVDIPEITNLRINRYRSFPSTTLFDLTLTVKESKSNFKLIWEYNTNLFDDKTIHKIIRWYENILGNSINDFDQKATQVDFQTFEEKQLIEKFNSTDSTIIQSCFIQEFEQCAEKYPDRIAAISDQETIDYKTLNKRANILARKLLAQNIGSSDAVGVLMPRGIDLIVSILAIWKVRAAYVPLEPDFPDERILQMCKQANISCVIADSEKDREKFYEEEVFFLTYNTVLEEIAAVNSENLNIKGSVRDLAYVIFTSGSTGKPKGVMIEQLGMVNHCYEMIKYFDLDKDTVMAQTASHCFDISVWQLTTPLMVGGKIVIYSKSHQLNLKDFLNSVEKDNISISELVPSYLTALLEHIDNNLADIDKFKKLKHMLTTGEAASNKLVGGWYSLFPKVPLTNAYGPAEASDDTNLYTLTKRDATPDRPIPVGKPLGNVKVYILDSFLNKCPVGIKGEIYISGIAVGKGYINDSEKTKSAFIIDPFSGSKEKMYKTGDIGSWNLNGTINFFGRADFQVKIRGYRIELEEIENQIKENPAISQAAVIVKNFENSKQLYGFITSQQTIKENSICDFLKTKLPSYMIPQRIIQLESMPLNNSGKIDRKALTKIDISVCKENSTENSSEKEQLLLGIWKTILKDGNITMDDNFFDLGGDSITSIQIISRLFSQGYDLGLENFFAHPTIRQLVPFIIERKDCKAIPISTEPFSLTPIQKSFFERSNINQNWYNQCIVIKGKDWNKGKLKEALLRTLQAHPAFSMRFNEDLKQHYAGLIDFSKHIFDYHDPNQQRKEPLLRMNQMINIKNGPVVVASIIDYGNARIELCIVAHHLVVDAFSWSVFVEDLENNYHNVVLAKNQERRTSGTNLQQWANYLEQKSTEADISAMLPFWVNILKADTDLSILSASEKHHVENFRLITASAIDLETSKKIIGYASTNKTLKMEHFVLAIISRSLCNRLLANKITFMLERHGRSQIPDGINISRTIGWFTVIHPFLVKSYESIIDQTYAIARDLKEINDDGISYGLLRHKDKELKALNEPVIAVNFLGEMSRAGSDECFSDYKLLQDQVIDPKSPLEYKLEINSHISEGRLFFECTYDPQDISTFAVEQLIAEIKRSTESVCRGIEDSQAKGEFNMELTVLSNDRLLAIQNRLNGSITNG